MRSINVTCRPTAIYWLIGVLFGCLYGCTSTPSTLPDGSLPELTINRVEPATVLPGSLIKVFGQGFVGENEGSLIVLLERVGISRMISPDRINDGELNFTIDQATFGMLGGPGRFEGVLKVQVDYAAGTSQSAESPVDWSLTQTLQPQLSSFSPAHEGGPVYLGSQATASGSGFLMGSKKEDGSVVGEGVTELRISGKFTPEGGQEQDWSGACILSTTSVMRDNLNGPFPAECIGIKPGTFEGDVSVVNIHIDDLEVAGNTLSGVSIELGPTVLTRVTPTQAARGQWIEMSGRGFVSGKATTVVVIDGTFTTNDNEVINYHGEDALSIVPEVISGDTMNYVLRVVSDGKGGVTGLGSRAGVLSGTATPVVYWNNEEQIGIPLPSGIDFTVLPQKQVIFIKYLPGFTDALRVFGLRNVEHLIRQRIFEVVQRDYLGINVEFRETRPTDFIEYAVIEIGGQDPNDRDLIGLDNTMGKDIGNVVFDDVVGGWNADSAEVGTAAFGGVFISSYLGFSPSSDQPMPLAVDLFDDIFGPFMPSQGGQKVEDGELPNGDRADEIGLAILSLANMIGNTLTHEMGHTMGLAAGPAELFHNIEPQENQIMDAGIYRDFEERAELNGKGPAIWTIENRAYLERVLPVD
ncbi:MAG: hypothetical protein JRJ87_09345 [Deltaproteobacteria bacterium]|nr:hypothetical protein [Deltaproteobacteria bacterium]